MALVAALAVPGIALAQSQVYKAQRFDAEVQVLRGGNLHVEETLVFEFQGGTFTRVWRDIPLAKTDGIQILDVTLDGRPVPRGDGPGHVTVTGRTTVHVQWQLDPTGPSVHTFGLTYVAYGVGRSERDRDLVEWQPLPTEHRYAIDSSRVVFRTPEPPVDAPSLKSHRTSQSNIAVENGVITASATGISSNGWMSIGLAFTQGALVQAQPRWKVRQEAQAATAPRWALIAVVVFAGSLVLLMLARGGYRAPSPAAESAETLPPEMLQPAIAAALLSRGNPRAVNAMATLLDLAERGVVSVRELPHRLGVRGFALSQVPGSHDLAGHEETALRLAFSDRGDEVSLAKARGRLARGGRRFSAALGEDLAARGLLDPGRKAVRDRVTITGVVLLLTGVVGALATIPLVPDRGAWPLLIGLALALGGVIGLTMGAGTSALTDEGARQAARWRGFRRHLKAVASSRDEDAVPAAPAAWAAYAAALGLGYYWARYLKRHPVSVPGWFAALDPAHADAAYVAFMGSAGAHGGAGAGGGSGAAGGGGSGAA